MVAFDQAVGSPLFRHGKNMMTKSQLIEISRKPSIWVLSCLLSVSCIYPGSAAGETYYFLDEDGVAHFSNEPMDSRFRRHREENPFVQVDRKMLERIIVSTARQHSVETALVKAVVKVESSFDPNAVSVSGAMGLMQLMPGTASFLGVTNPFDPAENVSGGVRLLRSHLDQYGGNITLALAAYHAGPGRVKTHGGVPPIPQTHRYIWKVLKAYKTYQKNYPPTRSTYKITKEDGSEIFTNVPENYRDSRRYRVSYEK